MYQNKVNSRPVSTFKSKMKEKKESFNENFVFGLKTTTELLLAVYLRLLSVRGQINPNRKPHPDLFSSYSLIQTHKAPVSGSDFAANDHPGPPL